MNFLLFVRSSALIFFLYSFSFAQKPELVFHQLSTKDGLSQNSVLSITEDKKGFMWFATEDGANRYDGYDFQVYRNNPNDPYSLTSSHVKYLYVDHNGTMWLCTVAGLNFFDSKSDKFYNYKSKKYPALNPFKGDLDLICQDSKHNYWVLSTWFGLHKISDLNKESEKYYSPPSDNSIIFRTMAIYDDETIFIGTNNGLQKFNTKTKTAEDLGLKYGKGYQINKILITPGKSLVLGTTDGLKIIRKDGTMKEYRSNPSDIYSIISNNVNDILSYNGGNFLIGIDGGGIEYFDVALERFYHYNKDNETQLSGNNIVDIFRDSKGDIWASTFLNGVNFSNTTTNLFVLIKNQSGTDNTSPNAIINFFFKDSKGNYWIGTDGGGLFKKELNNEKYINYSTLSKPQPLLSNAMIAMAEDKDGTLYFTSWGGGLTELNPLTKQFKFYKTDPSDPNSISNDKTKAVHIYRDEIWISGFGNGLSVLDTKTKKFRHYKTNYEDSTTGEIPCDWVQSFYTNKKGELWLATLSGLARYIPEKDKFQSYLRGWQFVDIEEDDHGNLWLGTMNQGLVYFNTSNGTYKTYTVHEGLSDNNIKSFLKDDHDNIWITTNNGITKVHTPSMTFKAYTFKEGVPYCAFSLNSKYRDEQGRLYFGTNNGYMMINPSLAASNKNIPSVVITELKIFNEVMLPMQANSPLTKTILETNEITLDYNQNSLSFEFAALNFNNSKNNQYKYMLEGFDEKWVTASNRIATYTNLNPGTYKFKVIASNNDNVWNKKGTTILVTINPPFYITWWFYLLEVLFFLTLWSLSIYFNTFRSDSYINSVLTFITMIATIEFINTVIDNYINVDNNPVILFVTNLVVAMILIPVEDYMKNGILKIKKILNPGKVNKEEMKQV